MSLATLVLFWFRSLAPAVENDELGIEIAEASIVSPLPGETSEGTAAILTAIAFYESGFRHGVRGDNGRARCEMQLWSAPGAEDDRATCVRVALARVRESMLICGKGNPLGIYASGPKGCRSDAAKRVSVSRFWLARKLVKDGAK